MRNKAQAERSRLRVFLLLLGTATVGGCGGIQATRSVSPLDFIVPGLHLQNTPQPPAVPGPGDALPVLASAR